MRTLVFEDDIVARIGCDEFVIVTKCVNSVQLRAAKLKKQLIEVLADPYYVSGGFNGIIGASIGIAINHDCNDTTESLLKAADKQMYKEKQCRLPSRLKITPEIE